MKIQGIFENVDTQYIRESLSYWRRSYKFWCQQLRNPYINAGVALSSAKRAKAFVRESCRVLAKRVNVQGPRF